MMRMTNHQPTPPSAAAVLSDHSSKGFEDVLQRIQSKKLIASVAGLLAAVDGPDSFPPMSPRLKRSPRAVEAARQQQVRCGDRCAVCVSQGKACAHPFLSLQHAYATSPRPASSSRPS